MLFNSNIFLFVFLPVTAAVFFMIGGGRRYGLASLWLILASLFYYGWGSPQSLAVLALSIAGNYAVARLLRQERWSRVALPLGLVGNLAALFYYKYMGFFTGWLMPDAGLAAVLLPLGISFFTFQQITYLIDSRNGAVKDHGLLDYCLYVTFFPRLIAGPIVHYNEVMGQVHRRRGFHFHPRYLADGLLVLSMGLFKKCVIADSLGAWVGPAFKAAATGSGTITFIEGWCAALAYAFQVYFDFAGYSDMAVGIAILFGIRLPMNFNSPFKAPSIIEFWQRWHMTLTRFLMAYIYNPVTLWATRRRLAQGKPLLRRGHESMGAFVSLLAFPTVLTMVAAGVWHGAGVQYVMFGVVMGLSLVVNHGWRIVSRRIPGAAAPGLRPLYVLLTFLWLVFTFVIFRSDNLQAMIHMVRALIGLNGVAIGPGILAQMGGVGERLVHWGVAPTITPFASQAAMLANAVLAAVVWLAPNSHEIGKMAGVPGALGQVRVAAGWRNRLPVPLVWGLAGVAFALAVATFSETSEFVYFQF